MLSHDHSWLPCVRGPTWPTMLCWAVCYLQTFPVYYYTRLHGGTALCVFHTLRWGYNMGVYDSSIGYSWMNTKHPAGSITGTVFVYI